MTIGVRNLDKALELFHRRMDLDMDDFGDMPDDILAAWGLPAAASAQYALLSRDGYRADKLRLIQWDLVAQHVVRNDLLPGGPDLPLDIGPKAIDLYIPGDMPAAVGTLEAMGYPLINGPVNYEFSGLIEAMHAGPDGVSLLLMTRPDGPSGDIRPDLPKGTYGEIASLSVVSALPMDSARFYGDLLQIPKTLDREASPRIARAVATLNGFPPETRVHWQMYVEENQPSAKMALVHYPGNAGKRLTGRMRPGRIGICLYSFERSDLDTLTRHAREMEFAVDVLPTQTDWGRLVLIRGPNEELIEVTEV